MYRYEVCKMDDLRVGDLKVVKDILQKELGFEDIEYKNVINHISFICLCRINNILIDRIVGIGAIKKSNNKEFKKSIFTSANRLDIIEECTNEIGYLWTDSFHRRNGVSTNIIQSLINRFYPINKGTLYATVKVDNEGSINTLLKNGFYSSVSEYGVENFVNIKSGNVLKLMLFDKDKLIKKEEVIDKTIKIVSCMEDKNKKKRLIN